MNRAATPRLGRRLRAGRPQWVRTGTWYLQVYAFLWTWMWAIVLLGAAVALVVINRFGTVEASMLQVVRNGPGVWLLFVVAVIVTTSYLPIHVANGMTRRSAIRGALVAVVLGSLLFSVAMTLAMLAEGALYESFGWTHGTFSGADAAVWQRGAGPMFLDYTLACLGGAVSGLLVGIVYYRAGGWWGSLALPLTVLPALTVTFLPGTDVTLGSWVLPVGLAHGFTTLLVLAAALAFALLARHVPIARTES